MNRFADLLFRIDEARSPERKKTILKEYFLAVDPSEGPWALKLLLGQGPKRQVQLATLRLLVVQRTPIAEWLFEESLKVVGDLSETIALLAPGPAGATKDAFPLVDWITDRVEYLSSCEEEARDQSILDSWLFLSPVARILFNRLVSGTFRPPIKEELVFEALSSAFNLSLSVIAHRLSRNWLPTPAFFDRLCTADISDSASSQPYDLVWVQPFEGDHAGLGEAGNWFAEWKWDGVRAQLIRRSGQTFIWSSQETLLTEWFPEIVGVSEALPEGTVLDGEIVGWDADKPLGRPVVQSRLDRKRGTIQAASSPEFRFVAFDALEFGGKDIRHHPLFERRALLEGLVGTCPTSLFDEPSGHAGVLVINSGLNVSVGIVEFDWIDLKEKFQSAKALGVEGMVLKRRDSPYGADEASPNWLAWKIERLSVNAVLMYGERGVGQQSTVYVGLTFGVWSGTDLLPIAKVSCDLDELELKEIENFIKANTVEKFGPVRTVKPEIVMDIQFEGIDQAPRRKAGLVLRGAKIHRWLREKSPNEGDTLESLKSNANKP